MEHFGLLLVPFLFHYFCVFLCPDDDDELDIRILLVELIASFHGLMRKLTVWAADVKEN